MKGGGWVGEGVKRFPALPRNAWHLDISEVKPEGRIQCRDGCIYAICNPPTGERERGCLTRNMTSLGILRLCFEKDSAGRAALRVIMIMIMITPPRWTSGD